MHATHSCLSDWNVQLCVTVTIRLTNWHVHHCQGLHRLLKPLENVFLLALKMPWKHQHFYTYTNKPSVAEH